MPNSSLSYATKIAGRTTYVAPAPVFQETHLGTNTFASSPELPSIQDPFSAVPPQNFSELHLLRAFECNGFQHIFWLLAAITGGDLVFN